MVLDLIELELEFSDLVQAFKGSLTAVINDNHLDSDGPLTRCCDQRDGDQTRPLLRRVYR